MLIMNLHLHIDLSFLFRFLLTYYKDRWQYDPCKITTKSSSSVCIVRSATSQFLRLPDADPVDPLRTESQDTPRPCDPLTESPDSPPRIYILDRQPAPICEDLTCTAPHYIDIGFVVTKHPEVDRTLAEQQWDPSPGVGFFSFGLAHAFRRP